jgi:phosphoserine phosphatase
LPVLDPAGWRPEVYQGLVKLVEAQANTGKLVLFDFDNTTQARDVSEAALGVAEVNNLPSAADIPAALAPPIGDGKSTVTINDGLVKYYEAFASLGGEGFRYADKHGQAESNLWAGLAFTGLTVNDYVKTVAKAYGNGIALTDLQTGKESKVGGVGRPFVYPQMADLYGYLRSRGYNVYVVSAGIAWGVRYMVKTALNPVIAAKYGAAAQLPLDHVVGITTLLKDKVNGDVWTDTGVRNAPAAAAFLNLQPTALKQFEILGLPGSTVSWGGGKVAAVLREISRDRPYLVGGDALGDHELLNIAENRLWIARLDKPANQRQIAEQINVDQPGNWLLQPTISSAPAGFASDICQIQARPGMTPKVQNDIKASLESITPTGKLDGFSDCARGAPSP